MHNGTHRTLRTNWLAERLAKAHQQRIHQLPTFSRKPRFHSLPSLLRRLYRSISHPSDPIGYPMHMRVYTYTLNLTKGPLQQQVCHLLADSRQRYQILEVVGNLSAVLVPDNDSSPLNVICLFISVADTRNPLV